MGLNRHEQRQLDQLMADLSRRDPVFVARMSTRSRARLQRIRRTRAVGAARSFTTMTVLVASGVLGAGIRPALVVLLFALDASVLGSRRDGSGPGPDLEAPDRLTHNELGPGGPGEHRYGCCYQCGRPIAVERMHALPRATLCLACQQHD